MGCVYSKGKIEKSDFLSISDDYFNGIDKGGYLNSFDSGELRMTSARTRSGKVPEMSSIIGRASIASLERAVEVLDTLGSSMSSLNSNNGFVSRVSNRGNKVSILAFEVANTVAKGANLLRSLSEENIRFLKEEVLKSDGVRELVSMDDRELMIIAAADKRYELDVFSTEAIRFGNLCKDPTWHNLGRYFQKLGSELTPQEPPIEEVEATMQQLVNLAQSTSELYHELHALDRFEQDFQRKLRGKGEVHAANRENLMILQSELKCQRKLVKSLKKKSLWFKNLEEVVEKLVDVVVYLHKAIVEAFGVTEPMYYIPDTDLVENGLVHNQRLGISGLALHYANIINKIDNIVTRPLSLPANTRDTLYHGLPMGVKAALRSRIQSFDSNDEHTVAQIKAEMQKTLGWIVPLADNTLKSHQGFGWVGEWANVCTETNKKPTPQQSITRIQTLYHAKTEKTEQHILELVAWLHHLVIQVRNKGFGINSTRSIQSNSSIENRKKMAVTSNSKPVIVFELTQEEREMLDSVGSKKLLLGRSKSQDTTIVKHARCKLSKSFGSSPSKEFNMSLESHLERTRVLDILDGLSTCS